jgi:hypothetical protein
MKKLAMVLILVFAATSLLAGGKECNINKTAAKKVQLTGTFAHVGSGDEAKTVFRVADSDRSYTVCHKSKADVAKLSNSTVKVSGKLVHCGDSEELMIEEAKQI